MGSENTKDEEEANGTIHAEQEDLKSQLRRPAWRALIQDFSPIWFTWCMNSGIISILLHQLPYKFNGQDVLADIFFVFDLSLFAVFSVLLLTRFAMFRSEAYKELSGDISTLTLCACWPIAFMTLTSLVALVVSHTQWGGYAFTIVAYVMWWFLVGWTYTVLFWVFITLIRKHDASDRRMPTTVIIPAVSVSTLAVTGAIVSYDGFEVSARLAVPVIIVSFMSVGIGIILGIMLFVYLFHQLLVKGFPAPEQVTSMFIFVGPSGQSAAALQLLGAAASVGKKFAGYNKGTFLTAETAPALSAACNLVALLLFGLGIVWTVFAVYAMIECAVQRKLIWTPIWNAIIFPMGTMATSMTEFAVEMDSPAFRVITTGLLLILVFFFLLNLAFTMHGILKGRLLIVRDDPRVKAKMESQQKER